MPRRLAAWARLRPSARASAKLANTTVNHSHKVILRIKPLDASPWPPRDCSHSSVVRMLPKLLQQPRHGSAWLPLEASQLRKDNVVLIEAGDLVPLDGVVIEGVASVDESAITGESAPVIREAGGDFSSVTGGTRVLSDWLVVRISVNPGESFLDRMISMVESAKRQKTPNEVALTILLVGLTLLFLLVIATLSPYSVFAVAMSGTGSVISATVLVALLVCLIPTTIGGLLSAIGVAGMSRMMSANVIATSGRAVEAARPGNGRSG